MDDQKRPIALKYGNIDITESSWKQTVLNQLDADFENECSTEIEPKEKFAKCKEDHSRMIFAKLFSKEHLPEGLRDDDLYQFIKIFAKITVRIETDFASPKRKRKLNKNNPRHGTGRLCNVTIHSSENRFFSKLKVCECEKFKHSRNPSREWGEILIFTAAHFVYDNDEAKSSRCRLFYDSKDSPEIYLHGISIVEWDAERDWCRFKCVTCDMQLVRKLEKMVTLFFTRWNEIYQKYKSSCEKHKLTVIVSHPHGYVKRISLGEWQERTHCAPYHSQYTYDASTCPGSSGSTVHLVGISGGNGTWFDQHIHQGRWGHLNLGSSGVGWENKY